MQQRSRRVAASRPNTELSGLEQEQSKAVKGAGSRQGKTGRRRCGTTELTERAVKNGLLKQRGLVAVGAPGANVIEQHRRTGETARCRGTRNRHRFASKGRHHGGGNRSSVARRGMARLCGITLDRQTSAGIRQDGSAQPSGDLLVNHPTRRSVSRNRPASSRQSGWSVHLLSLRRVMELAQPPQVHRHHVVTSAPGG